MWSWLYFLTLFSCSLTQRAGHLFFSFIFASHIKHGQRVHLWTNNLYGKINEAEIKFTNAGWLSFFSGIGKLLGQQKLFCQSFMWCYNMCTACPEFVPKMCCWELFFCCFFFFFSKRWVFCVSISESVQLFTPCTLTVWMDLCLLVMLWAISCSLTGFLWCQPLQPDLWFRYKNFRGPFLFEENYFFMKAFLPLVTLGKSLELVHFTELDMLYPN